MKCGAKMVVAVVAAASMNLLAVPLVALAEHQTGLAVAQAVVDLALIMVVGVQHNLARPQVALVAMGKPVVLM
jgi:hypothetical protein